MMQGAFACLLALATSTLGEYDTPPVEQYPQDSSTPSYFQPPSGRLYDPIPGGYDPLPDDVYGPEVDSYGPLGGDYGPPGGGYGPGGDYGPVDDYAGYTAPPVIYPSGISPDCPFAPLWLVVWERVHINKHKLKVVKDYRDDVTMQTNKVSQKVFAWCRSKTENYFASIVLNNCN